MSLNAHYGAWRAVRQGAFVVVTATAVAAGMWRWMPDGRLVAQEAAKTQAAPAVTIVERAGGRRDSYADIVKAVAPAVVTVRVEGTERAQVAGPGDDFMRRFFGQQFEGRPQAPRSFRRAGLGSGVIVDSAGYIVTNHHVVASADRIRVDLSDGRSLPATLIGTDAPSDLALIKVDAKGLPIVRLGDSDAVEVGDVALAIGNPLGVGQTVTMGIVGAKGRSTGVGDGSFEDFIQTDAPINHGNSGGALISTKGDLIGINSQILSTSEGNIGIGFAIPAKMVSNVVAQLRTSGSVRRGQLGISVQGLTPDLAASLQLNERTGALVSAVNAGSAAEAAGVKRGDLIVSFAGAAVSSSNDLRNHVAETAPGSKVTMQVVRDGQRRDLTVTLGELAPNRAQAASREQPDDRASLGIAVTPVTPALASERGLPPSAKGLLVESVTPDSRAERAGLRPGDLIEEVNRQPVRELSALREAVRSTTDRPLLLLVNRGGNQLYVTTGAS